MSKAVDMNRQQEDVEDVGEDLGCDLGKEETLRKRLPKDSLV